MKKTAAFLTALALFAVIVVSIHFYTSATLEKPHPEFGMWVSSAKFASHEAIAKNMNEDSLLVLGSSEFRHGNKTQYHPGKLFENQKMKPMLIGAAWYQCLSHATTLAALEPDMKNRKVALVVSPQWFVPKGVKPENFTLRFSESNYIAMLENQKIPQDLKARIGARTEKLLVDPTKKKNIRMYNRIFIYKNASKTDKLHFKIRKAFVKERDRIKVCAAMMKAGKTGKAKRHHRTAAVPDWQKLWHSAEKTGRKESTNKFFMLNRVYKKKFEKNLKKFKNMRKNQSYAKSLEYGDLRCFLDVCKARKIKPLLIIVPVNGFWYDYLGFPKEGRAKYYKNIRKIAREYGADTADLSRYEYEPYFMEDAGHVTLKGWVELNKGLYDFYNKK